LPEGRYPFITEDAIKVCVTKLDAVPFDSPEYRRLAAQWRGYEYYAASRSVYALLDKDNVLYVGGGDRIVAYGDVEPGNPNSAIEKKGELVFDPSRLNKGRGFMFGIAMNFDGHLVAASQDGTVVGCSRDFQVCHYHTLGDEQIWNGIAVDENGGCMSRPTRSYPSSSGRGMASATIRAMVHGVSPTRLVRSMPNATREGARALRPR